MNHYHVWAHTLFPKSKFSDTIKTVEKVCKKRNMLVRRPRRVRARACASPPLLLESHKS